MIRPVALRTIFFTRGVTCILVVAGLLAVSNCGQISAGANNHPGLAPGTSSSATPGPAAPKVTDPIRTIARWQNAPCDLLDVSQLSQLGFRPNRTTPTAGDGGAGCTYNQMSIIEVRTTIFTDIPGGLTRLYAERSAFRLFDPIGQIKSHPAVIADTADQRTNGRCAVFAGLTDALAYRTIVEADPKTKPGQNPCKFAADLTVLALHAMKEADP